ncbi:MAG: dihydrofolate reductase [Clostridiales bacterium]|jgi:dihydrofolate reductase|nr:dihydrofolate reductase [Clostridiales bacterium]
MAWNKHGGKRGIWEKHGSGVRVFVKLIVSVDERWGIGRDNRLLFPIPDDMAFFKRATQGKVLVMGRATLDSLPRSEPLKGRINIVLSKDETLRIGGAMACSSIARLGAVLAMFDSDDVFVIGGHSVYSQLLAHCGEALVTKVRADGRADRFFPDLDSDSGWAVASRSEDRLHNGLRYSFFVYRNKNAKEMPRDAGAGVWPAARG